MKKDLLSKLSVPLITFLTVAGLYSQSLESYSSNSPPPMDETYANPPAVTRTAKAPVYEYTLSTTNSWWGDKNVGYLKFMPGKSLEFYVNVSKIPFLGKHIKKITPEFLRLKEYVYIENLNDSTHIQIRNEKKFISTSQDQETWMRKDILYLKKDDWVGIDPNKKTGKDTLQFEIIEGIEPITFITKRFNGEPWNQLNTYFFWIPYTGRITDMVDSVRVDPDSVFTIENQKITPISKDLDVALREMVGEFVDDVLLYAKGNVYKSGFRIATLEAKLNSR
ncbi:hypothetical protein ACFLZJ_01580 [Nanoarchaeota archaeon]